MREEFRRTSRSLTANEDGDVAALCQEGEETIEGDSIEEWWAWPTVVIFFRPSEIPGCTGGVVEWKMAAAAKMRSIGS
jgi:hypothetical protein